MARYVRESTWHETQKLTIEKDGSLLAKFRLSDTEEIKRWILSFGQHAEVLKPEKLRREVADELKLTTEKYRKTTASDARLQPLVAPVPR